MNHISSWIPASTLHNIAERLRNIAQVAKLGHHLKCGTKGS